MKKMGKKFTFLLAIVMLITMVSTACSPSNNAQTSQSPQSATGSGAPASAAASGSGDQASSGNSAERAIQAAKQFSGQSISVTYEAGLQANNPKAMKDQWEKATGVKLNIIELPNGDLYTKPLNAHLAGDQEADVLLTQPSWLPDFVESGVIIPDISPYIQKYADPNDLAKLPESYKSFTQYKGKTVGFLTDGDVQVLYYRKDWFNDEANKSEFKQKYGYDLAAPTTWKQFDEIAKFFTDKGKGQTYGVTLQRAPGQAYEFYNQEFGGLGGQYFDENSMKPLINGPIGVQAMKNVIYTTKLMPPGAAKYDFVQAMTPFLDGKAAMMYTWPPIGKFSGGMAKGQQALSFVPESKVVGKVGFAMPPGAANFSAGLELTISAASKNTDLAYLFAQWYASPEIHKQWIVLPDSLGKPTYTNEFEDPAILKLFPGADEWVQAIKQGSEHPHPDVILPGANDYALAVDQAVSAALAGTDPQAALDTAAKKWEEITDRLGRDKQKEAYVNSLLPIEKAGMGKTETDVPPAN